MARPSWPATGSSPSRCPTDCPKPNRSSRRVQHPIACPSLVLTASFAAPVWGVPSTAVTVSGQVTAPTTLGYSALQALPQTTRTEIYRAGGTPVTDTFTGPTLWSVLNAAGGIATNSTIKSDVLQTFVIATGMDGYKSVISAGEIAPNFGRRQDLVAIGDTGGTLPGSAGVARVTASGDVAGGRYVSNTASLQVGHGPTIAGTGGGVTTSFTVGGAVNMPISFTLPSLQALTRTAIQSFSTVLVSFATKQPRARRSNVTELS